MRTIIILFTLFAIPIIFFSCSDSPIKSAATYDKDLVESKKITLPIDENMFYLSKRIFQYEENNREYLFFGNFEKGTYEIILFDINQENVYKKIPLSKEGPNGVPAIAGCKPFDGSNKFIAFQNNLSRISIINGEGNVLKRYSTNPGDERFIRCHDGSSYSSKPAFIKDSILYFSSSVQKPNIKYYEWVNVPMFSSLDLRTGEINQPQINYPPIFEKNVKNLAGGDEFGYNYNYEEDFLVCSFYGYDSLMVVNKMRDVRWYDGKSRYLKSIRPKLAEAGNLIQTVTGFRENPLYTHVLYDKYRNVYYRFVELPYELQDDESPFEEPKGREFSVIVFDRNFQIIGETKFPGGKYFYKMSFVGRDGLYISENNLANPEFDEDKLVFACFKLEDIKGKDE